MTTSENGTSGGGGGEAAGLDPSMAWIGNTTTRSQLELERTLKVTETFPHFARVLPPQAGSELARLDAEVQGKVPIGVTLDAAMRSATDALDHLRLFLSQGVAPPAAVVMALSRVALLGTSRVLYVLGPQDRNERVDHLQRVARAETHSFHRMLKTGAAWEHFPLGAGQVLVAEVKAELDANPGPRVTDTSMVTEIPQTVAAAFVRAEHDGFSDQNEATLREHMQWMWQVWSGGAHGWSWPEHLPGSNDVQHRVPGDWVSDLSLLASLTQLALKTLARATRHVTDAGGVSQ